MKRAKMRLRRSKCHRLQRRWRSEAPVAEPLSEREEPWRARERMHWRHAWLFRLEEFV